MLLAEKKYDFQNIVKGYAGRTLFIDLDHNQIEIKEVSEFMKETFIGGKGFDLWLMWNSLPKNKIVKWDDPENEICISSGPLGGSTFLPGAGKSIVTTVSPLTGIIIDSNVGGYFGPFLKFSGFDSLEIKGKAKEDVIIVIDGRNRTVKIEKSEIKTELSHLLTQELTEKYADTPKDRNKISVVTTGPAAKHTKLGMLNFSFWRNSCKWASSKQAGRGGIGTVFADKGIKSLICISPKFTKNSNNADNLQKGVEAGKLHAKEILENDPKQNMMRFIGTGHLPIIMAEFDLFPTENYRFGRMKGSPSAKKQNIEHFPYDNDVWKELFTNTGKGFDGCWLGCSVNCAHIIHNYEVMTGPFKGKKVYVDGPEYETIAGCGSNWGVWDARWPVEGNFYCDTYGLDTISIGTSIAFVMECYELGIINKEITGGLDLSFGNAKEAMELVHQMAKGEGFGVIVGQGIRNMKRIFAEKYGGNPQLLQDIGMEHKGLEFSEYVSKESLTQQGGYCLTLKGPQHDEAWLIFEDVVRKSIPTFQDKANALCWFPFWRTWFGLNGLCKLPWNDVQPPDNKENPIHDPVTGHLMRARVPKHVLYYSKYYESITGRKASPETLITDSERVYNFQRIFNIRLGGGLREHDSNPPYRAMGPVTKIEYEARFERFDTQLKELGNDIDEKSTEEKIKILRKHREDQYRKLQDAVYSERGWNIKGCPTIKHVKQIGLDLEEIINVIKKHQ